VANNYFYFFKNLSAELERETAKLC